jgi:DNA-binding NarL/FixJ family response regulator
MDPKRRPQPKTPDKPFAAQPQKPSAKRIFIVEDHPLFRQGLAEMREPEAEFTVCGSAANAEQAWKAIASLRPDLLLVDISLPGKSGLQLIKEVRKLKWPMKILVVSMHDEALYAERVLRAGADGYIMKEEDAAGMSAQECGTSSNSSRSTH